MHDKPKLNQEDIKHINRTITSNKIETIVSQIRKAKDSIHCWIQPDL
jgi:hypothetical protein